MLYSGKDFQFEIGCLLFGVPVVAFLGGLFVGYLIWY
jgi:hypothetical protein